MKKILISFILSLMFLCSIQSQSITDTKHVYKIDSLICLDKTAANRVMADKYNLQIMTENVNQLDSAYSTKVLENDTLRNKNVDLQNALTLCGNDSIMEKQRSKPYKILTYVFGGLTLLLTITKL